MKSKAYREGRRAFFAGVRCIDNPYPLSQENFEWDSGWEDAKRLCEPNKETTDAAETK